MKYTWNVSLTAFSRTGNFFLNSIFFHFGRGDPSKNPGFITSIWYLYITPFLYFVLAYQVHFYVNFVRGTGSFKQLRGTRDVDFVRGTCKQLRRRLRLFCQVIFSVQKTQKVHRSCQRQVLFDV
jgi:hypothetical protein